MSRLFLLRHAKAGWAEPGMRDFDRPLDATGRADADAIGAVLSASALKPDLIVCSSAKRARETLEGVAPHLAPGSRTVFTDGLYSTDAAGYVDVIHEYGKADAMLLIGHNPMMEDVAFALYDGGEQNAKDALITGFPTSGLAVIRFPNGLANAAPGKGYLEAFYTPADR
ncbi:MAG TPA: histidine phosphatase family protein [Rhizobiaceae bacterium]|nr:histidine phosphatase family protein [Rhizobiaceae bacterium]